MKNYQLFIVSLIGMLTLSYVGWQILLSQFDTDEKLLGISNEYTEPTQKPTVEPAISPTFQKTDMTTPVPADSNKTQSRLWIYPGAYDVIDTTEKISFRSGDDPEKIFKWYQSQISLSDYSVRNSIKTKVNDSEQQILQVINEYEEIKIVIEKTNLNDFSSINIQRIYQ